MDQLNIINDPSENKRHNNLCRLLRPRHIAYIGGTQIRGALATSLKAGFEGELWVVNPSRDEIDGFQCYSSIEQLPKPPDAALIGLSPDKSIMAVKQLAALGSGGAVCMAAGFAETSNSGAALQQQLKDAAADMAIVGPNCMGILNLFEGAAVWGSANRIEQPGNKAAAIISQSGAFLYGITNVEQGFPLGYAISTGNQAVIDIADCIEAVLTDDRIQAIGIYLEGLDNGNALAKACWHALDKGIPIIAMKGGDTAQAAAVAISHTSAMVVERDLWLAFCKRCGIVEVSTPKSMVETLKLLTIGGIPAGNRLTAITYSGGLNSLIVAQAPTQDIELKPPSVENTIILSNRLPETVAIANPLDLNLPWVSRTGLSLKDGDAIADCLCTLSSEVADIATMFLDVPGLNESGADEYGSNDWYPSMEAMAQIKNRLSIPCAVAGILPEGLSPDLRRHLIHLGIAPLLGFHDAMQAISTATKVGAVHQNKSNQSQPGSLLNLKDTHTEHRHRFMLDEAQSKKRLAAYGLNTPTYKALSKEQLTHTATAIGYPVALKLVSNSISHKAKIGGVKLGLNSNAQLEQAACEILDSAKRHANIEVERFLIEAMVTNPVAEYIIGIKQQPALGLALMIGRGGVTAESINNFSTVLLPLVEDDLEDAMYSIGITRDTIGYQALFKSARSIASYALDHAHELESLDVNPIMVTQSGDAIATDALIVLLQ